MKTGLTEKIPDSGIELAGLTLHRVDRVTSTSGKLRGGGLAIYTNNLWCCDARMISKTSFSDVEFMTVRSRPFYLPRELTAILLLQCTVCSPKCRWKAGDGRNLQHSESDTDSPS